ncbi:RNA polymerase sigma factor [Microcella sp.]|uniref:RNA polymerase sigma factor n=1 Tax=Microcella sp. TaxID=1913979 RepID=UPI00391A689E
MPHEPHAGPVSEAVARRLAAVWRIEGARVIATLASLTRDVGLAEDLAQEACAEALRSWQRDGVPANPGAWLTAVAKRRAIDAWRRQDALAERYARIASTLRESGDDELEPIGDSVLRLLFIACHPVLSTPAQCALALTLVGGLSTEQVARLFLVPIATMQQRIVRAKRSLSVAAVPFEAPDPQEWHDRLTGVLRVVYLIFTEGYAPASGTAPVHRELADEALRLGRRLVAMVPREPEAHGLLALMLLQASRFSARVAADGSPVLLADQDRARWDRQAILRGRAALRQVDVLGKGRGPYAVQAAIAEQHAIATSVEATDWDRIVLLYEVLGRLAPSPVVELNRAVAVSMTEGPAEALAIVDRLAADGALAHSHLLPSVRGELLARLERPDEARAEFARAIPLIGNAAQRTVLDGKLRALDPRHPEG